MKATIHHIALATRGNADIHDLTARVRDILTESGAADGLLTVFVPGSTAGITTTEFEPGLRKDLPAAFERIAPSSIPYAHDATWHDGNGHSHVRASLVGPGITVPFSGGELLLGTWQNIVLIDFDNRPRRREVIVQVLGE